MTVRRNIVIFYTDGMQSYEMLSALIENNSSSIIAVVQLPIIPYKKKDQKKNWKLLGKGTKSAPSYLIMNIFTLIIFKYLSMLSGKNIRKISKKTGLVFVRHEIIDDIFVEMIKSMNPDYIINASSTIIGSNLLQAARIGIVNFHGAPVPEYRGAANYYWLPLAGVKQFYGSFHYVDEGVDTGDVIEFSDPLPIDPGDSVFDIWFRTTQAGARMFGKHALHMASGARLEATPQDHRKGVVRSFPSAEDAKRLRAMGHPTFRIRDAFFIIRRALFG